jgi:hypothetical protein
VIADDGVDEFFHLQVREHLAGDLAE